MKGLNTVVTDHTEGATYQAKHVWRSALILKVNFSISSKYGCKIDEGERKRVWTVYHKNKNPALKPYTVVATNGVPLNQMSEGKFNLHLTMHSLIGANIVKRKINSSLQYG